MLQAYVVSFHLLLCVILMCITADKREFLRISQAVGMGFLIMGVIGYIVKLSKLQSVPFLSAARVRVEQNTDVYWQSIFL